MGLGNLSRLSDAKSRSISPENLTGEKGRGGMAEDSAGASMPAASAAAEDFALDAHRAQSNVAAR